MRASFLTASLLLVAVSTLATACGDDSDDAASGGGGATSSATSTTSQTGQGGSGGGDQGPFTDGDAGFDVTWETGIVCESNILSHAVDAFGLTADGDILYGATLDGVCSFFGAPQTTTLGADLVLGRLDGSTGEPIVTRQLGGNGEQRSTDGDAGPAGLILSGPFSETLTLDDGAPIEAGENGSYFIAAFDADANAGYRFDTPDTLVSFEVTRATSGELGLAGSPVGQDYGDGPLVGELGSAFFALLGADGASAWSATFGDLLNGMFVYDVALGDDLTLYAVGEVGGSVDLGGGVVLTAPSTDRALFVAAFDDDGTPRFGRVIEGASASLVGSVTASPGGAVFALPAPGVLDLGDGPRGKGGTPAKWVAQIDADGTVGWAQAIEGASVERTVVSVAPDGFVHVGGSFSGEMTFDGAKHASAGRRDAFLLGIDPSGAAHGAQRWGTADYDEVIDAIAAANADRVYVLSYGLREEPIERSVETLTLLER